MNKSFLPSLSQRSNKNTMPKLVLGFTLIELLVVIAIIGILSSVVLASVNSARNKAANTVVKSNMSNLRTQSVIFYDDNFQSYSNLCDDAKFSSILGAATNTGGGPTTTVLTYCASDINSWSAYSFLKAPESSNSYWCSNSAGLSKATDTIPDTWATSSCQ